MRIAPEGRCEHTCRVVAPMSVTREGASLTSGAWPLADDQSNCRSSRAGRESPPYVRESGVSRHEQHLPDSRLVRMAARSPGRSRRGRLWCAAEHLSRGHDVGQRCLAKTRGTVEQHVSKRFARRARCLQKHDRFALSLSLPDELLQPPRAQRGFHLRVFVVPVSAVILLSTGSVLMVSSVGWVVLPSVTVPGSGTLLIRHCAGKSFTCAISALPDGARRGRPGQAHLYLVQIPDYEL